MVKIHRSIITIFFLALTISFNALATPKEASNFISDLADRVINIVKNQSINDKDKETQLNNIFLQAVDTKWIARFALGRYWRTITPTQQNNFLNLYSEYLSGIYVPNFRKYTGNVIKVTGVSQISNEEYLVQTVIIDPINTSEIQINYRLLQQEGFEKFIIFDIIAEGVSLITTQRAELNSVMADGGFDMLVAKLTQKTLASAK